MKDVKYQSEFHYNKHNSDDSKNSKILSIILKTGIVKDVKQANILLFSVAIALFILAIVIFSSKQPVFDEKDMINIPDNVPYQDHYKYFE